MFFAQNANNRILFRTAGLYSEEEPACERDGDGPVDQRKNDEVDHVSLYCRLALPSHSKSHRLSELSGLAAADLIDNALNPIGCSEDCADLAAVVKKAEDGNAVGSFARNALSPGGKSRVAGGIPIQNPRTN